MTLDGKTDLYYFSFTTLTSLGIADVTPVSDPVQLMASMEAVVGAILIAALVGRIVGLLVAQEASGILAHQRAAIERDAPRSTGNDAREPS